MIYVFRYLMIVLVTLFWGPPACLAAVVDRSGESIVWIGRLWVRWILALVRVRVEATGLENLEGGGPFVVMSNHQSVFDIAALVATFPLSWRFVAKRELTWIPLFGWALGLSDQVIIDRGNHEKAVRSLQRAAERVRRGTTVIIYPEGTRSASGTLREFKSGGFHLAIASQVPVLPVSVSGSLRITPKGSLRIESGVIRIHYGKPIATKQLTIEERAELKEQVRDAILAGFEPDAGGAALPAEA